MPLGEDPGVTSAKALVRAWEAGSDPLGLRERRLEGALFAVRVDRGWDVWFTETSRGVVRTLGVVTVLWDGAIAAIRSEERPWSLPAGVEDARRMGTLRPDAASAPER